MLRFPNPGSDLRNYVAVYNAIYREYFPRVVGLDDIVKATVTANLATSSGHSGNQAIARSTRADRSRDPLYNQLKMYAELYRSLGWLHPTSESSLKYTFTQAGSQLVEAGDYYLPFVEECVLGISYPSHVLNILGNFNIRPFALLLKTMLVCDDCLSRDEMIIGPLSTENDQEEKCLIYLENLIFNARKSSEAIEEQLLKLSIKRNIQINTLRNYTRFPIAIMRDCGWTEKSRSYYTGSTKQFEVHKLTSKGKRLAEKLNAATDLRIGVIDKLDSLQKEIISKYSYYGMLERSGFDTSGIEDDATQIREEFDKLKHTLQIDNKNLLFSPFQSLSVSDISNIFPLEISANQNTKEHVSQYRIDRNLLSNGVGRDSREHLFKKADSVKRFQVAINDDNALYVLLRDYIDKNKELRIASRLFSKSRKADTKNEFYPLIQNLFRILGFNCDYSRPGVNYQRWDACIRFDSTTIPIEIKSPTEELFLSTKAVRQALENKIILLSRSPHLTLPDSTSLIIGYQIPSERAEMANLIDDIQKTYSFKIGVIDLETLSYLAMRLIRDQVGISDTVIRSLNGFLYV
jgi:hypothetical protein